MDHLMHHLNKFRLKRISLYGLTLVIFLFILILSHLLIDSVWIYTLVVFDSIILLIVAMTFIEVKVGMKYELMYHQQFIPRLLKEVNPSYEYTRNPHQHNFNIMDTKVFNYSSELIVNNVLRFNNDEILYELYDINIYISTRRTTKINEFKGYLFTFKNPLNEIEDVLILHKKRPLLGSYKEGKNFGVSKYKVYNGTNNEVDLDFLKEILKKQFNEKQKFQVIIKDYVMVLKPSLISFYHKPFFRTINASFIEHKKKQFKKIESFMQEFITGFKNT